MPYLTLRENLKLQLSPGLVASYDIQPGNGVGLFWDKHTHVYPLTYLLAPNPHGATEEHADLRDFQHFLDNTAIELDGLKLF